MLPIKLLKSGILYFFFVLSPVNVFMKISGYLKKGQYFIIIYQENYKQNLTATNLKCGFVVVFLFIYKFVYIFILTKTF